MSSRKTPDCSCVKISTESSSNLCHTHRNRLKKNIVLDHEVCGNVLCMQQWNINLLLRNYPYLVLIMKGKIFTL